MHLAIDASNIRQGGGVTHLSQLLSAAKPAESGITQITVWTSEATAAQLPEAPWLTKLSPAWTEAGFFWQLWGQQLLLGRAMATRRCGALFSPGGTVPFHVAVPVVTISQNMLPFEPQEAMRFGRWRWMRLKMWLLRQLQSRSFAKADGLIFLTRYAREGVGRWLGKTKGLQALIPHGIEPRFLTNPKLQAAAHEYSTERPFTFLYVSILMPYKHQIEVAQAASVLRREGIPVRVRFVGADWGRYGKAFRKILQQLDPKGEFLIWPGGMPFEALHAEYHAADAFLFASTCENLPNILIEAMSAGLPIACSNHGPMLEVLGDAGVYFDPLQVQEIAEAMRKLFYSAGLRERVAAQAKAFSQVYSWHRCAKDTFNFIAAVAVQSGAIQASQK
jgi:glycosyltransferase involved in cell wall biosynthesis